MDYFYDSEAQPDDFITPTRVGTKYQMLCQLCPRLRPGREVSLLERRILINGKYVVCEECKQIRRNERAKGYVAKRKVCD